MKCDTIADGVDRRGQGGRPQGAARRAPRRHQRRAGQEDPRRERARTSSPPADMADGAQEGRRGRAGGSADERPRRTRTRGSSSRASPARPARSTPSRCVEYGTNVVAGVTPGKGGDDVRGQVPVFDTVAEAVKKTGANATRHLRAAAGRRRRDPRGRRRRHRSSIVCITEGIPTLRHGQGQARARARLPGRRRSIGPNCPGVITPGECKIGIMPGYIHKPGDVGVVSRSGTLTYEAVDQLTTLGLGQSTAIGIGGDPVKGIDFIDALDAVRGAIRDTHGGHHDRRDRRRRRGARRARSSRRT